MINDKMISEGRQVAGLENAVDQAREGEDGWVKDQKDNPDKMANSKLVDEIMDNINAANLTESACINYAEENGYSKSDGQKAWQEIFRGMKDLDKSKKDYEGHDKPNRMNNCTHCLGNGIMPLVGTPCLVCNATDTCEVCGKDKPSSSMTKDGDHSVCKECKASGNYDFGNATKVDLDLYEQREFDRMTANGQSAEKALEILINTVEGDWSQLSTGLKRYAKSIGRSEGS